MPIILACFVWSRAGKTSRSVSANLKFKLEVSKVPAPAPVVKLDSGLDWPVSSKINLSELGGSLASILMAECH